MSHSPQMPITDRSATLMRAWNALQGSRVIAVHSPVIHVTGSLKAAILLSQLIYWTRIGERITANQGWVFKKTHELTDETGLTRREQDTAKEKLITLGLLEVKRTKVGMNSGLAFRVNLQKLGQKLAGFLQVDLTGQQLDITSLRNGTLNRKLFGRTVAYHRDLVHLTGDINAAVMLSTVFLQMKRRFENFDTPFVSIRIDEWQNFTGLSWYEQYNARKKLLRYGVLLEKHLEASRRIYLFVDGNTVLKFYANTLPGILERKLENDKYTKKTLKNSQIAGFHSSDCGISHIEENQTLTDNNKLCNPDCTKLGIRHAQKSELDVNKTVNTNSTKLRNSGTKLGIVYGKDYITPDYSSKDYNNALVQTLLALPTIAEEPSSSVVVVPVGKNISVGNSFAEVQNQPQPQPQQQPLFSLQTDLIWPKHFSKAQQLTGISLFHTLLHEQAIVPMQSLLDEIAGQDNVRSPLGLLRALILSHNNGTFIPLLAHKARDGRKLQEAIRRQIEAATVSEHKAIKTEPSREVARNALAEIWKVIPGQRKNI